MSWTPPVGDDLDAAAINTLRTAAQTAARQAGQLAQAMRGQFTVAEKGPADLVTTADPAAQRLIVESLGRQFADGTFLGEEDGLTADAAKPLCWIIDPIDGTTNYVHGFPFYGVSVGAQWRGRMVAGAVYDPNRDEMFSAGLGQGATLNGQRLSVSGTATLEHALLATGFPPVFGKVYAAQLTEVFARFGAASQSILRLGSATLSLAYVAAGRLDGLYALSWKPWDIAAGALLVAEAGGRLTNSDAAANPRPGTLAGFDHYRPDLIATNGAGSLHEQVHALASPLMIAMAAAAPRL